ncbi:MAG: metalloregulator ArsR/SmtB family transcription factor [Thiohalomonadaceae bacterium]|jgi:ArsR family transcriptional regulator
MTLAVDSLFRALANPIRLRCLLLLHNAGELCVCELTHALGASQPKISRHLAQLREADIVSDRRMGLWVYYRLHPQLPGWAQEILRATANSVGDQAPFITSQQALATMPNRPGADRCA